MDTKTPWVAIVDDDEAIRHALLRLLDSAGIDAQAYPSGADLINALGGHPPCCVVLDLHMPGISGHQVQARLADMAPFTHVIAMTGQHSASAEARVLQYRNATYLCKPVPEESLLQAIALATISHDVFTTHQEQP
jgi:FixJ family two-component response regulator